MYRKLFILILYISTLTEARAQKETSNWYFSSNEGISFNTGSPQPIQGIPSAIYFYDSETICSDANGNVRFICTPGYPSIVMDKNYNQMPGPIPTGSSSFARPMWAKYPGSNSKFFVFYPVAAPSTIICKLKYAIIDMSLNGGLGQVTVSDITIDSSLSVGYCLINKPGSDEFWIINNLYRTNNFYARLVTAAGVSASKITSIAGLDPITTEYNFQTMKASPDGKLIAGGIYTFYNTTPFYNQKANIEVFNFNRQTGILTNRVITTYSYPPLKHLEFSPDSRLLYCVDNWVVAGLQPCGFASSRVYQYNLCYTDSVSFSKHAIFLGDKTIFCYYPLLGNPQLALDKQIYFRFPGSISRIKFPNRVGSSCQLLMDAIPTGSSQNVYVPSFSQTEISKSVNNNILYSGGCYPNPVNFSITNDTISQVLWNFGDPASGAQNTSNSLTPSHVFSAPGIYTVTASLYDSNNNLVEIVNETVEIKNPASRLLANFPADTILCTGSKLKINLSVTNGFFEWSSRDPGNPTINPLGISDSITITSSGMYYVRMEQNGCAGCEMIDSINVTFNQGPVVNLGSDQFLCYNDSVRIGVNDPANNINCIWNTGATTDSIWVNNPGQYWVSASINNNGCYISDTINVSVNPAVNFSLPADTVLCSGQTLLLNAGIPGAQYLWQDNSTASTFNVTAPGLYWVRVTFHGCMKTDSINVTYASGQPVNLGPDSSLCIGNTLTLSSNVTGTAYLWNTGANTPSITVNSSGQYWLRVQFTGGCWSADTIHVLFSPIPFFSFGPDTILCQNNTLLLSSAISGASYLWQDNSIAPSYSVSNAGLYWLQVTNNGCAFRDSIVVAYKPGPILDLGKDTSICTGSSLLLNATNLNTVSWLWQDGTNNPTYTVTIPGLYFVEATAINGCKKKDSIIISILPFPSFNLGNDTTICSTNSLVLKTNLNGLPHLWNNGSVATSITVTSPGLYWVEVNNNGCKKRDSINVYVDPLPVVNLGKDTVLCNSMTLLLDATNINASYTWQDGTVQPVFLVTAAGLYYVRVKMNGCYASDSIHIFYSSKPIFTLGPDQFICGGNTIILDPGITGSNYLWQDGSTNRKYLVQRPGQYSVTLNNQCGFSSDTILIQKGFCDLYFPNTFTPNGDSKNDFFKPLTTSTLNRYQFQVFNRYGEVVFQTTDPSKGWDGNFKGKKQNADTYVWICVYQINGRMLNTETGTVILTR